VLLGKVQNKLHPLFSLELTHNSLACSMNGVLQGEIWANDEYALRMMHCTHAHATINGGNWVVTHYYNP